jgi:hypothetical protein
MLCCNRLLRENYVVVDFGFNRVYVVNKLVPIFGYTCISSYLLVECLARGVCLWRRGAMLSSFVILSVSLWIGITCAVVCSAGLDTCSVFMDI